jgi:hypothetical protein
MERKRRDGCHGQGDTGGRRLRLNGVSDFNGIRVDCRFLK